MNEKHYSLEHVIHPWNPIFNENSKILILGSFPSPKSRLNGFYYGHPQNIFWDTIAKILNVPAPASDAKSKTEFLLKNKIAIWDTIGECDIKGAEDSSIRNPKPNDIKKIIDSSNIKAIFTTGKKSTELYNKLCFKTTGIECIYLPSTSPANRAQQKKESYLEQWKKILEYLN
ncbi:MAG: DNA-deoxyinosine glycosylase [Firmicutes bacterium]|nr:DNA-deoxyinosine glycosylase [Bacillota bacterium]